MYVLTIFRDKNTRTHVKHEFIYSSEFIYSKSLENHFRGCCNWTSVSVSFTPPERLQVDEKSRRVTFMVLLAVGGTVISFP